MQPTRKAHRTPVRLLRLAFCIATLRAPSLSANRPAFDMPGRTYSRKAHVRDKGNADQFYFPLSFDVREGRAIFLPPSGGSPVTTTQFAPDESVAVNDIAVSDRSKPSELTVAPQPRDKAVTADQSDRDRGLALQLLDLDWTTLSPEQRQAVRILIDAVIAGQPILPEKG